MFKISKAIKGLATTVLSKVKIGHKNYNGKICKEVGQQFHNKELKAISKISDINLVKYKLQEEFKEYKLLGYNFADQKDGLERSMSYLCDDKIGSEKNNDLLEMLSLKDRMLELSVSGYILRYTGEEGLRNSLKEIISSKQECLNEMMIIISGIDNISEIDRIEEVDVLGGMGII
ncbi:hypothetical protein [Rickettsia endosymbiont of Polydrusus tereticollis]|uniref:hypothetical protein n=1 Tax=Rickettsia endosymbiont of Polydrusus tereticollis TaxID=3066251 RepID=UPI0031334467